MVDKFNIDLNSPFEDTCPHYKEITSLPYAEGYRSALAGETFGFINGCFDPLHVGHIWLLNKARTYCDHLWVGMNSDYYIRNNKSKPNGEAFIPQMGRVYSLLSLEAVTGVHVFNSNNCGSVISTLKPDVYIRSKEYQKYVEVECPTASYAANNMSEENWAASNVGAHTEYVDMLPGYSSTSLLEKLSQSDKLDDIL